MEKQKNLSFKQLEVIWNRNTSTHIPKLLPELKGINIEDSVEKVKKSVKPLVIKINENKKEHVHNRVKRSLFQENKNEKVNKRSNPEELNKKLCKTFNCANNLRKRTYSINKKSQLNLFTQSPQIISNRKKIIRNQDAPIHKSKKCLFQTKSEFSSSHMVNDASIIKSSCHMDLQNVHTKVFNYSKSPEIMSNLKRFIMYNNLDKTNTSSYDNDKCLLPIVQEAEKLNTKYKNVNTHISKTNSVHSEDIIESSEKITSPIKKNKKNNKNIIHNKKSKINNYINQNKVSECKTFYYEKSEMNLPKNVIQKSTEISTVIQNKFCNKINFDSIDIINTENILECPVTELNTNSYCKEPKKSIIVSQEHQNPKPEKSTIINGDNQRCYSDTSLTHSSLNTKEFSKNTAKECSKIFKPHRTKLFNQNEDNVISLIHSTEIDVIPATPEHESINVHNSIVQYSPEIILNPYFPLIEVDQSPTTPHERNCQVLIQSVQTPPNVDGTTLPNLFEPIASPIQSFVNELPFKIDVVESPRATHENDDIVFSPEINRRKSDNSPSSPNHFDSAKKRKKMCKDGLRGKFRDLINRKKSEARIREYEKSLSKSYKPKQGENVLLNVIEAWMEFSMIVLLCYYMKSDNDVQKVFVTLDNCSIKATKNSIIRIYSPWLTIKSEVTDVLLFVGVIHAEVIEFSESITRPLKEKCTDTNGLLTTVFQNKVVWKCNCSKDAACECLGELSVYNYMQYMMPH